MARVGPGARSMSVSLSGATRAAGLAPAEAAEHHRPSGPGADEPRAAGGVAAGRGGSSRARDRTAQ